MVFEAAPACEGPGVRVDFGVACGDAGGRPFERLILEHLKAVSKTAKFFTYVIVAAIAATAGFGAVYVTLAAKGNGDGLQARPANGISERLVAAARGSFSSARPVTTEHKPRGLEGLNRGAMAAFLVRKKPMVIPDVAFKDASGKIRNISEWKNKVVLLNLWATWCAPCRREMPDIEKLKTTLGGSDFDVVAVSIDKGAISRPKRFFDQVGVKALELFQDSSTKINADLRAFGMPTTLLINRDGHEIGRLIGPAKWDGPDALRLIKAAIGLTG